MAVSVQPTPSALPALLAVFVLERLPRRPPKDSIPAVEALCLVQAQDHHYMRGLLSLVEGHRAEGGGDTIEIAVQ